MSGMTLDRRTDFFRPWAEKVPNISINPPYRAVVAIEKPRKINANGWCAVSSGGRGRWFESTHSDHFM